VTVLSLCRQFHCLSWQLDREDVYLLRLLAIEEYGVRKEEHPDGEQ
jgi:hypothetical protein